MKKNIVLIGMPGAGKSTIGVILAKMLGMDFIDADLVIQKEEGRLLSQIIQDEGADGFLAIEERVNAGLSPENAVIATGGSVVYGKRAMEHLRRTGTVVYLRLSYPEVAGRLNDIHGRGVVLRDGQTLMDLYEERTLLYEKYAHVIVDEDGLDVEATLEKILQVLG
jgi:shikimate kinase